MVRVTRVVFGLCCLIVCAHTATAQEPLSLKIQNGRVTINAQNVPLRTILAEWARVGGTNVVGADRVAGAPVTMELADVPERQALDVLLRNVSGYMLALRPAGTAGASVYNRILIMPPSTAPRALPQQAGGVAPRLPQVGVPNADDVAPEAVRLPNGIGQNNQVPSPMPVPETATPVPPVTPEVVVTPGNPFGVPTGSSSRPGAVTPVPQQQPGGQRPDQN